MGIETAIRLLAGAVLVLVLVPFVGARLWQRFGEPPRWLGAWARRAGVVMAVLVAALALLVFAGEYHRAGYW